jgi:ADP-ribose diphosphatase
MRSPPIIHARRSLDPAGRFRVEEIDLEFANGARRTFERLQSGGFGAVIIVPMRDDDTVLLVREYAAGLHRYELGLPKGRIDAGEDAPQAANRELKEEIGFGAHDLQLLVPLSLAPSYMAHRTQVVIARRLYPEKLEGDEPEELDVVPWRMDRLNELIGHPECSEGRTLAALFIAREFLAGRWRPPAPPVDAR